MRRLLVLVAAAAVLFAGCTTKEKKTIDYVDPFIGTAFHGHTFPGATAPFGAVQLSPDNYRNVWDACSGYHYDQPEIIGFSHNHLSGTGCADLADVLFHPTTHDVDLTKEGDIFDFLPYSHKDEEATPGYYSVFFRKEGVKAELTATTHTGWHRYSWAKGKPHNLVIDMHHSITAEKIQEVEIFQTAPDEIRGMRKSTAWTPDQYVYFVAQFSRDIEGIRYIDGHKEVAGPTDCTTDDRQVVLSFGEDGGQVVVKVGISQTSYEGAEENLVREGGAYCFDFDQIRKETAASWEALLSSISVEGGTEAQKRTFYTALYHTAVVPNETSDADKMYRRQNDEISKVRFGKAFYSTLSLWDVFRAWLPLSSFVYPSVLHDIVYSCLDMYQATGELPIWPLASGETRCMIGYHSIPFIVDAFLKGFLPEIDAEYALEAMVTSSNINPNGSQYFSTIGYIPANKFAQSVSTMLEYAYDDWCIARFAEVIGKTDVAEEYYKRARNYVNVFDGSTGFFRGRNLDGTLNEPFNIFDPAAREYTEATAWQYRYFVPQDFAGFACLLGGTDKLAQAVDDCFAAKSELEGFRSDVTGLIGQYAHGNEPSHHMAYIYNYVGQPWKTQEWTRRICKEMYTDKPDGLCGNEDCGQMSAWYVMTALGLYEVCPGSLQFAVTSPIFDKAVIALPNGRMLTISANNPAKNTYIHKLTLNGKEIDKPYLTWAELLEGGELCFELGTEPDKELWTSPDVAPFSLTKEPFVSKPWYKSSAPIQIFPGTTEITLGCLTEGATVRYTLDGSEPTADSPVYEAPFTLDKTTEVRAVAFKEGLVPSAELRFTATRADAQPADHGEHSEHGVSYKFYHGDFSSVDQIEGGEFISEGTLVRPSLEPADVEDYYGFVYTGWIYIPESRVWEFSLTCDDGAVLWIGDRVAVDNDGSHSVSTVKGLIPLEEGYYPITLKYLESYEGEELHIGWLPTGADKHAPVPDENFFLK